MNFKINHHAIVFLISILLFAFFSLFYDSILNPGDQLKYLTMSIEPRLNFGYVDRWTLWSLVGIFNLFITKANIIFYLSILVNIGILISSYYFVISFINNKKAVIFLFVFILILSSSFIYPYLSLLYPTHILTIVSLLALNSLINYKEGIESYKIGFYLSMSFLTKIQSLKLWIE